MGRGFMGWGGVLLPLEPFLLPPCGGGGFALS